MIDLLEELRFAELVFNRSYIPGSKGEREYMDRQGYSLADIDWLTRQQVAARKRKKVKRED